MTAQNADAAVITQSVNSASGTTWNNAIWGTPTAQVPTSGNTYLAAAGLSAATNTNLGFNVTGTVRDNGSIFGGDSLTLGSGTRLLLKNTGGASSTANIVLNGGLIQLAPDSGSSAVLAGSIQVAATSYLAVVQTATTSLTVNSTLTGSSVLRLAGGTSAAGGGSRSITFNGNLSGFTGTLAVGNSSATAGDRYALALDFDQDYYLPAVSLDMGSYFTADTLRLDQALSFGSFTFNGNSLAAGTYTAGQLNAMFGNGSQFINGGGSLTVVPEPQTCALLAAGLAGLFWLRRSKA